MIKFCSKLAKKIQRIGRSADHAEQGHDTAAAEEALLNAVLGPQHWLIEPGIGDAETAIAAGAVACKVEPAGFADAIAQGRVSESVREQVRGTDTAFCAVDSYLQYVAELAQLFTDHFLGVDGNEGWVAVEIASDPAGDTATLITDARALHAVAENVIPVISATEAGLDAIEFLISENTPVMVSDVVSVAQAARLAEAYETASAATGFSPAIIVEYAPLAFNEALAEIVRSYNDYVTPEALAIAGLSMTQHLHERLEALEFHGYHLVNDAHPGTFGEELFDCAFAMDLGSLCAVEADDSQPVYWRENTALLAELTNTIPEFSSAWKEDGLRPDQFANFAPVKRARLLREQRWQKLTDTVRNEQSLGV